MEMMGNRTLKNTMSFVMTVVEENLWVEVLRFEVLNTESHRTVFVQFNEELSESTMLDIEERMMTNSEVRVVDFSEDRSLGVTNMFIEFK